MLKKIGWYVCDVLRLSVSIFAAIPLGFLWLVRWHAKTVLSRIRHPGVTFEEGAYADVHSVFEGPAHIWNDSLLSGVVWGLHSYCSSGCRINNVTVGRYCSLGQNVQIGLGFHPTKFISTFPGFYSTRRHTVNFWKTNSVEEIKSTAIGNDVWIGANVMIPGGISVGDGAIIGAGSVVTKDVPPYAIVAGVPARIIGYRFEESEVVSLLQDAWWNNNEDWLRSHGHLFCDPQGYFEYISQRTRKI